MAGEAAIDWDAIPDVSPQRAWSPMQQAIFDFVAEGKGHGVVEALAGTGKSTTIEEVVRRAPAEASILVAAFNKSIAEAMKVRLQDVGCDVLTLHSLGLRAVTRAHGRREIEKPAGRYVSIHVANTIHEKEARQACKALISWAKNTLLDVDDYDALDEALDERGLDVEGSMRARIVRTAQSLLLRAADSASGPIDFDDMIWLPAVQGLRVPKYEWVFVDETQDLNPAQLWLARAACAEGGRIVAVGDRRQSIYAFRGADTQAIPRMIRELGATTLPLSVTYRCPRAVVREANRFVPALQAAPGAPEGHVRRCSEAELMGRAAPGDMVLSRVNAPLISLALGWLGEGRKCRIQGRNIGEGLVKLLQLLSKKAASSSVASLLVALRRWHDSERERLTAAERDTQEADDKAACIEALCDDADTIGQVIENAERLFSDEGGEGILLSSTHRAKGLEADRVWVLWETYRPTADEQERNLCYVAITRAKSELIYVAESEES